MGAWDVVGAATLADDTAPPPLRGTAKPMDVRTCWALLARQKLKKALSKEAGDLTPATTFRFPGNQQPRTNITPCGTVLV
jgi:hypothetical protein